MTKRRASLPYPPAIETGVFKVRNDSGLEGLSEMVRQQEKLLLEAELIEAQASFLAFESQCGATDDTQDVELYDGSLGVSVDVVRRYSPAVGQLQWVSDLKDRFRRPNDSPGNVNGVRWGSGFLIKPSLFLTAGHCFARSGGGWERPKRNGVTVTEDEIAKLMKVNFNFQLNGETRQLREEHSFPVTQLQEFRFGNLDYAIVELGPNAEGELAGKKFGSLAPAPDDLITKGALLCVIQHPNGKPKMVEAGPLVNNSNGKISYDSIDTLGGSSGAAVLNAETGQVVGVHTTGGCTAFSGENFGVAIGAIKKFSGIL